MNTNEYEKGLNNKHSRFYNNVEFCSNNIWLIIYNYGFVQNLIFCRI